MKAKKILAVVTLVFLVLQACQSPEKRVKTEPSETKEHAPDEAIIPDTLGLNRGANLTIFMNETALDGMMEIELAKIAKQKATNIHIKRYARRVLNDHTKIAEQLKVLAESKKIPLPTALPKDDLEHIAELQKMPVKEFEKHYMGMMVKGHVKALELFKSATTSGDSPLQNFAIPALRKIEQHYTLAMDISKHLK